MNVVDWLSQEAKNPALQTGVGASCRPACKLDRKRINWAAAKADAEKIAACIDITERKQCVAV